MPAGPPRVPDRRAGGGASRYLRHGDTPLSLAGRVLRSRWRALTDRFSRDFMRRTLRIGVSARIFHPEPGATGLRSKNLQYLEESIAQWVMSRDVLVFMVPTVNTERPAPPQQHHHAPLRAPPGRPGAAGRGRRLAEDLCRSPDPARMERRPRARRVRTGAAARIRRRRQAGAGHLPRLPADQRGLRRHACTRTWRPTCRTPWPTCTRTTTRTATRSCSRPAPRWARCSRTRRAPIVNSIHHQAVKDLGRDITVEAMSEPDGVVEAIRYQRAPFVMGLQWHPEFHRAKGDRAARLHAGAGRVSARGARDAAMNRLFDKLIARLYVAAASPAPRSRRPRRRSAHLRSGRCGSGRSRAIACLRAASVR